MIFCKILKWFGVHLNWIRKSNINSNLESGKRCRYWPIGFRPSLRLHVPHWYAGPTCRRPLYIRSKPLTCEPHLSFESLASLYSVTYTHRRWSHHPQPKHRPCSCHSTPAMKCIQAIFSPLFPLPMSCNLTTRVHRHSTGVRPRCSCRSHLPSIDGALL